MDGKKKVLFIVSSLNYGGAQKVVSNISTSLPDYYEIDILLNSDENIQYPYKGRLISLDVKEPGKRDGIVYQFRVFCKRLRTIRRLKRMNRYDSVVSNLTSANVANILCRSYDCKTVITEVFMPSETPSFKENYIIGGLTTRYYNKADCVVAETKAIGDNLVRNHKVDIGKIYIIPNSIDTEEINRQAEREISEEEKSIFNHDKTFVTAGRMTYQKGQWHLIRAFSKVVQYDKEARLVIFGEGELKKYLSDLIKELKLEDNVLLYGFTDELDKYVGKCRAFVLPSMYEGMPTALLQAMAAGIPCITTDFFSGAREVLGDSQTPDEHIQETLFTDWGVLCPVFSGEFREPCDDLEHAESLFADSMIRMLSDEELWMRYSEAARIRSLDFDNKNIIQKWMDVI